MFKYANAPAIATVTGHCFAAVFHYIYAVVSEDTIKIENYKVYVR